MQRKRGWESNQEIIDILEKMQLRIRKRIPDGEFKLTKLQQLAIDTPEFWRDWKNEESQNLMIQELLPLEKHFWLNWLLWILLHMIVGALLF